MRQVEVLAPVFYFWLCRDVFRKRHNVPEIEMKDDLNFSAIAHSDKQIPRQLSTIVFQIPLWERSMLIFTML